MARWRQGRAARAARIAERASMFRRTRFRLPTRGGNEHGDVRYWPHAGFLQRPHLCPLLGLMPTRIAQPELFRVWT